MTELTAIPAGDVRDVVAVVDTDDVLLSQAGTTAKTPMTAIKSYMGDEILAPATAFAAAAALSAAAAAASAAAADDAPAAAGFRDRTDYATLAADTTFTYTSGLEGTVVSGEIVRLRKEGLTFRVLPVVATDEDLTTAGGVLFEALPTAEGYDVRSFGAVIDGTTDDTAALQAAINRASKTAVYNIRIPAGTLRYSQVYCFYNASLNPGYLNPSGGRQRHGSLRLIGGGSVEISKIRADDPFYGTILDATGDGVVVSRASLSHNIDPYPARHFEAEDITFVGDKAGQYVIEIASCPFVTLRRCMLYQRNIDGHGLLNASAWFTKTEDVRIVGSTGATGRGLTAGTTIFAGQYNHYGLLIDTWNDGFVWQTGPFSNLAFYSPTFQNCERNSIRIEAGRIDQLTLISPYFEGFSRENDIRAIGTSLAQLVIKSGYATCGGSDMSSWLSGPIIDLDNIDMVTIEGFEAQRLSVPIMNVDALPNLGSSPGNVDGITVRQDAGDGLPTLGDFFLFTGQLPSFGENIVFPGYERGIYDATGPIRLFDPATLPHRFIDRRSGATILSPMGIGKTTTLSGPARVDPGALGQETAYDITVVGSAIPVFLPDGTSVPEGRLLYIANNAASSSFINIWQNDNEPLVLVARIQPGQGALVMWNGVTGAWQLLVLGVAQQSNITSLTDSTSGTVSNVVGAVTALSAISFATVSGTGDDADITANFAAVNTHITALNTRLAAANNALAALAGKVNELIVAARASGNLET
jgi:hypothetical protein